MTDKKKPVRTAKPKPAPADNANVRRAAVLHGMEVDEFLQYHTEGDADGIVANGGCRTRHKR